MTEYIIDFERDYSEFEDKTVKGFKAYGHAFLTIILEVKGKNGSEVNTILTQGGKKYRVSVEQIGVNN